jgi:hypothetical protein
MRDHLGRPDKLSSGVTAASTSLELTVTERSVVLLAADNATSTDSGGSVISPPNASLLSGLDSIWQVLFDLIGWISKLDLDSDVEDESLSLLAISVVLQKGVT